MRTPRPGDQRIQLTAQADAERGVEERGHEREPRRNLAEHRRAGDYLVLMSASTDLYVPVISRQLGFDETICTEVRWDGECLNGSLTTPNRKGEEKARCFTALRERHPGLQAGHLMRKGEAGDSLPAGG